MKAIIGIDEAGRGCWAGPLVAAAVLLRSPIQGLADSKTLSKRRRVVLAEVIYDRAEVGLGWASAQEIDKIGLTLATKNAMAAALSNITADYDEIIIDGNYNYLLALGRTSHISRVKALVNADGLIPAVSAASIIAKVARDNHMYEQAKQFPLYQFEKHAGYGTRLHHEMLKLHGSCELHRLSYKPLQALGVASNV